MDALYNNAVISNNLTVANNIECDSININSGVLNNITSLNGLTPQNLQTLDTTSSISYQLSNLNTNLTSYIDTQINNLLYNSDLSLNSIVELSNAIANDQNFAVNMASSIASKISKSDNNQTVTANNLNFSGTNTLINDLYVNDTIMILDNSNNSVTNLKSKLNTIDNNIANVISSNNAKNAQQDLSMNNIIGDINILSNNVDISLNSLIAKDSQIDASLNDIIDDINLLTDRVDLSLNSLINKDTQIDASLNAIITKNNQQDASLNNLIAKDTQIDASLNAIITKNNQQDTSLNNLIAKDTQIDASLNAIITKNNQQDTSLNNIRTNFRDEVLNINSDKFGFYTADNTELLIYDKVNNTVQINGNLINTNIVNNNIGLNGKLITNSEVFIHNTLDVDDISANNVIINSRNIITELNNIHATFAPKSLTSNYGIYDEGVPILIYNTSTNRVEIFLNMISVDYINSRIKLNNNTDVSGNFNINGVNVSDEITSIKTQVNMNNATLTNETINLSNQITALQESITSINALYASLQSHTVKASGLFDGAFHPDGIIRGGNYVHNYELYTNFSPGWLIRIKSDVQNIRGIVMASPADNTYTCSATYFANTSTIGQGYHAIHVVCYGGGSNPQVTLTEAFNWCII